MHSIPPQLLDEITHYVRSGADTDSDADSTWPHVHLVVHEMFAGIPDPKGHARMRHMLEEKWPTEMDSATYSPHIGCSGRTNFIWYIFSPSSGYLINSLYCCFWKNESMDHAHPKCTVNNVGEKWIWWKSDEMIYYVCTADLILHHIGEKLICSYHMSQFFRNSGWRRTTIEDATSADHAYNAWRLADASLYKSRRDWQHRLVEFRNLRF